MEFTLGATVEVVNGVLTEVPRGSVGKLIRDGITNAIDTIDSHRCYHRHGDNTLHFDIKMHNYRLPEQVREMLDDGYLDDERVSQTAYDSWAHELECFIEGLSEHASAKDDPYYIDGEPFPVELWFEPRIHGKHQNVYQCGRQGGYLQVPAPSARYGYDMYGTWEDAAELLRVAVQVERFATLVEHVRKLVDDGYSDPEGGTFYMLIEDEYPRYLEWREERDTPEVDEDDHY